MTDIYDMHRAAFRNVEAYVIMNGREPFAKIAFKYPRDGAGRLWAYVHILGIPMVRGYAAGYGYDKASAACASAVEKIVVIEPFGHVKDFVDALTIDNGFYWYDNLNKAGFVVVQAV